MKRLLAALLIGLVLTSAVVLLRRTPWADPLRVPSFRQKGPARALVTMMEFSDFQCSGCAKAQPFLKELLARNSGTVRLVFRNHPLKMHKWAFLAAQAADCAGAQGRFWEYHDVLFQNQKVWSASQDAKPLFLKYAEDLGLDVDRFRRELEEERWKSLTEQDLAEGAGREIQATPTFFINERRLVGEPQLQAYGHRYITLEAER